MVPSRALGDEEAYDHGRRRLLWGLTTGLYLLGTHHGDDLHVMTTSWATQLAISPKLVGVSVEANARTRQFIDASGSFLLALLAVDQKNIIRKFVKVDQRREVKEGSLAIEGVPFGLSEMGNPYPIAAAGFLEMKLVSRLELGSHTLFVGEVTDAVEFVLGAVMLSIRDTRMNYGG